MQFMATMVARLKKLLVAASLLLSAAVIGQSRIDSLDRALRDASSDSVRVLVLQRLAEEWQYLDHAKATRYAQQALDLTERSNLKWGLPNAYKWLSILSSSSGDYTTARRYDKQRVQATLAQKDSAQIANAFNYLGNTFFDLGEYDEAYYYFMQSFKVSQAISDSLQLTIALHNVGTVFKELHQFDVALTHLEQSRKISQLIRDYDGEAYSLDEIGGLQIMTGQFQQAETNLQKALALSRQRNLKDLEPRTLQKLAKLYFEKNALDKSIAYFDSTTRFHKRSSNRFGIAETSLGVGQVYIKQGKYKSAIALLEETLASAQTMNARTLEMDCFRELSSIYEMQGDYRKSLSYYKNYQTIQDSLYSQDMMTKLFKDQLRLETEIRDSEIAALSDANSRRDSELKKQEFIRNILAVTVALTVILLFAVYRSGQRRKRINKLLVDHQEEMERRSAELEQLNQVKDKFFSIISHDLRSPMNSLSGILDLLSRKHVSPEEFTQLTGELRVQFNHTKTLINNLLDWTLLQMDKLKIQQEKIDLRTMVDENFKLLSSMHLKETHMVNNIPAGTLALADPNMINLVLRNLVMNGIKFTETGGRIEVSVDAQGSEYIIAVNDNGVGIAPDVQKILFEKTAGYSTRGTANEKGTGLGLILAKEFVEKNGGKIWLQSEEGKGSTFYFTVKKA